MKTLFHRLASALYRTAQDKPITSSERQGDLLSHYLLFGLFFSAGAIGFLALFTLAILNWQLAPPVLPLPSTWLFSDEDPAGQNCERNGAEKVACFASPKNKALWQSQVLRAEAEPRARQVFWLGSDLTNLDAVKRERANRLVLGWVHGQYDIWVNGGWVAGGKSVGELPVIVALPFAQIESGKVKLAVRILPNSGLKVADEFAGAYTGFFTGVQAEAFLASSILKRKLVPHSVFLLNALFAIFFFLLWVKGKIRQEYFYLALFAAVSALAQLRALDIFTSQVSQSDTKILDVLLLSTEGAFGLLLGLSFARSRLSILRWGLPSFAGVPLLIQLLLTVTGVDWDFNLFLADAFLPLCYILGGLACLVQAIQIRNDKNLRERLLRLVCFGLGLLVLAFLARQAQGIGAARLQFFLLLLFLAGSAWNEGAHAQK